jgi:hypothetical protein
MANINIDDNLIVIRCVDHESVMMRSIGLSDKLEIIIYCPLSQQQTTVTLNNAESQQLVDFLVAFKQNESVKPVNIPCGDNNDESLYTFFMKQDSLGEPFRRVINMGVTINNYETRVSVDIDIEDEDHVIKSLVGEGV